MDIDQFFQDSHYNINRILLSISGLWPFHSKIRRYITYFILILIIGSGFFFQVMGIIEVRKDSFEIIDTLPTLSLAVVVMYKMIYAVYTLPKIKLLFIKIQEYSLSPKSNEEYKIQNSHALFGRNFSYVYMYIVLSHNFVFNVATLLTRLIYTEVENNDTSDEIIAAQIGVPYRVNYFVDLDTYYVPIFLHTTVCALYYVFVIVTLDALYITLVEHCRGLFVTVRYRLENALLFESGIDDSMKISTRDKSYANVIYSVRRHTETLQFINLVNTVYSPSLFVQIGCSILILSILGYQVITNTANINRCLKHVSYMNGLLINMFFENWQGQRIIDSSEKVFASVYNTEWYNMPIATRKLLRLIMMKSLRPMVLTASKFIILSYVTFNALIRTSSSYFMLLQSVS